MRSIYIKNMVCNRCIKVVREELEKLNLNVGKVTLGEAVITSPDEQIDLDKIGKVLEENGFELLGDKQAKLIEKIKVSIIDKIYSKDEDLEHFSFSKYLADQLGFSYQHLSNLFSSMEGITIEKYVINQKVERVKELLVYDELTLSEIAYKLGYSSVQHLSGQFKKVTGFTPSEFKNLKDKNRTPLDKI